MSTCTASGVVNIDHHFGLGYQSGRGELSPYPRVNCLRETFLGKEFFIDSQRACLLTEAYKKYASEPQVIKVARALENILLNVTIAIYDDELIVGETAAPEKFAPIYPEFSYAWITDEMRHAPFDQREHDQYYMDAATQEKLFSIEDYWEGNTVSEAIEAMLTFDEKKGSNMGKGLYLLNLYHLGGIGHFIADYPRLLSIGYGGLIKEIEGHLAGLGAMDAETIEKRHFYTAQLIVARASAAFIRRYADLAQAMAADMASQSRKTELLRIAANCRQVAEGPARDIWEALQLFLMATNIILIESNGHSISYGRMDQYLFPYYKNDMEQKRFSQDFVQELLETMYIKIGTNCKLRDRMTIISNAGRGWGGGKPDHWRRGQGRARRHQ